MENIIYKCYPVPGLKHETILDFFGKCVNNGYKVVKRNGAIYCDKDSFEWGYNLGFLIGGYKTDISNVPQVR